MGDPLIHPPLLTGRLVLLLVAGALGLTALTVALPVLPLAVVAVAHQRAAAGTVTGAVAAFTIAFELLAPGLLQRWRPRPLLLTGILVQLVAMLGLAGLRTLPAMLACGALTGAGFGMTVTVVVAAVGALAPPGRSGEAMGWFGLAASAPTILGPPLALLLLGARGPSAVFLAGAAACAAGAAAVLAVPIGAARPGAAAPRGAGVLSAMGSPGVLRVWLAFACTTVAYGAAVSFTPILLGTSGPGSASAFLLVFGLTRMLGRLAAGRAVDRAGERRLVLPSLAAGALAFALLQVRAVPVTVASAVLAGAAFGVIQTAAFVGLLNTAGHGRSAGVSGIWSMAMDAGIGAGSLAMAPVSAAVGLGPAFWLLPALYVLALGLRLAPPRSARLGRARAPERDRPDGERPGGEDADQADRSAGA